MDTLLAFSTQAGFFVRPLVLFCLALGLWFGLRRTPLAARSRLVTWLAISVPLLAWYLLVNWIGQNEIYRSMPWIVPVEIFVPPVIWLVLLMRSTRIAAIIDAIPQSWLIGIQAYRTFGFAFLVLWATGRAPGVFAIPAGGGDLLTGVLALPVALLVHWRVAYSRAAAYGWNLFGLADFVYGISIALLLATPGLRYPFIMIPTFMVPLAIILHSLSLWQLTRSARRDPRQNPRATALAH